MTNLENRVIAHHISPFLRLTENWIYKIIVNQKVYRPVVITKALQNKEHFPFKDVYALKSKSKITVALQLFASAFLGYIPLFSRACKNEGVSLLHVHFGTRGVKSIGLKKKLNVPMICSFYGFDAFKTPRKAKYQKAYRKLFNVADRVLVLGPYMKNELIKLGCPKGKIMIQHLGIDTQQIKFIKRNLDRTKPIRFLIAARFVEKKGLDVAIKAFALIKKDFNFIVELIGDGELKENLVNLIKTHNLENNFILHGFKPYNYFIERTYACDIYVLASKTTPENDKEGTPMSLVDAMAAGMPVVSTRHSDIPEIVIEGYNGFLAEENDVEDFANCLRRILLFEKFEELSTNARKHIESEFDVFVLTKKLEDIYKETIENYPL